MSSEVSNTKIIKTMALFAIPLIIVLAISLPYTVVEVNIIGQWFGIKNDIRAWINPAIYGSLFFLIAGVIVTIIRYNAWEQFSFTHLKKWRHVVWAIAVLMYVIWRVIESLNSPYK